MTQQLTKRDELLNYFDENLFNPILDWCESNNNKYIKQRVIYTRNVMFDKRKTPTQSLQYFWSAITGTEKSINFSNILKENNLVRFEDLLEDVKVRFNDEWLNK